MLSMPISAQSRCLAPTYQWLPGRPRPAQCRGRVSPLLAEPGHALAQLLLDRLVDGGAVGDARSHESILPHPAPAPGMDQPACCASASKGREALHWRRDQAGSDLAGARDPPAIPVLICGSTPVRTTLVTSIPVGVPRNPRIGTWYAVCSPSVISYIVCVAVSAKGTSPPTNFTIAGGRHREPADATGLGDRRVPDVGVGVLGAVVAEEESLGRVGRPGEPLLPVPETRIPKSVPLRAIVVTTEQPGMPWAAIVASLQAGIPRLRKKCSLAPEKRTASAMSLEEPSAVMRPGAAHEAA